ncbi:MAG TPA: HAMP domain-containing methyl-accepting chemotaxis protein [Polyangia bacterium]
MEWPKISIKWKIFHWCFSLAIGILAFNYWYTTKLVQRSAGRMTTELQGVFSRYQAFERAIAHGMAAACDVWAVSPQLRSVFAAGNDEAAKPVLVQVQQSLAQTIHPDFIILVDRHGDATAAGDIDASSARSMRAITDLRQGMSIDDSLLEYRNRAYVVAGEPVLRDGEVVGALLIGQHLERVFSDFKQGTDDDPKKQVELALIHNSRTTAASAHNDDWDDLARATRSDARETVQEGDEKVSVVRLHDGQHDFFPAQLNGYEGSSQGSLGNLFILRNRVERTQRMHAIVRDNLIESAVALALAAAIAFGISMVVTRPIRQFIDATADLGHEGGDVSRRLKVSRNAGIEMHELAENLNALFEKMQMLASEVQGASFQVGASSAEISAASKQMLGGAKDQAARIESSTAAVTELSSSIQTVADNAMQAQKVAEEAGSRAEGGIAGMHKMRSSFEDTAEKIRQLGESSKRIGNIVEVIRQISDQTSLLALNASIEAAHAGEQGRGFAVVADEVSQLAKRVGQSAKDIEALIATITEQTLEAVQSMQAGMAQVELGTGGVTSTLSSLKQIVDVISDTARSVQEQAVVSDEIARNMDAVQKIAQEVLGSSEEAVVQGEALHALAIKLEGLVRAFRVEPAHDGHAGNGAPRALGSSSAPALPERSSERRKTARG